MIGVFDSGIGGLTVLKELRRVFPDRDLLYLGDTARYPYGDKTAETITRYAGEDVRFLVDHGAQMIVIACNSVSAVAFEALKKEFPVPFFDVIRPAVAKAVQRTRLGRIGIIGTRATVGSELYPKLIHEKLPGAQVFQKACPLLVPLVEEGWLDEPETKRILRRYLAPLKAKQVDMLVLSCTHYPLLKKHIAAKIGKRTVLIDPAEEVAKAVQDYLKEHPDLDAALPKNGKREYFLTDPSPHSSEIARKWLGEKVAFQKAEL